MDIAIARLSPSSIFILNIFRKQLYHLDRDASCSDQQIPIRPGCWKDCESPIRRNEYAAGKVSIGLLAEPWNLP